jgi:hypothetical protein
LNNVFLRDEMNEGQFYVIYQQFKKYFINVSMTTAIYNQKYILYDVIDEYKSLICKMCKKQIIADNYIDYKKRVVVGMVNIYNSNQQHMLHLKLCLQCENKYYINLKQQLNCNLAIIIINYM